MKSQQRRDAYEKLESAREAFDAAFKLYIAGVIPNDKADAIRDKRIADMDRALSDLHKAFGQG
ncbi:hypothetical protein [Trinickia acidisoli]|uniref:hypothetical protein n=1 Tax=Trinickia acidisoli TaxID=2767482 RepID=UPI001A90B872|nr:hypothetical protein [Trinickia acidisoli]